MIKMEILNSFELFQTDVTNDLKVFIKSFYVFKTKKNENYENYYNVNTLFVTIDDKVFGFGYNENGVCGQGCNGNIIKPLSIPELCDKNVIEFFNGEDFVLCLTSNNHMYSWGKNDHGQLGFGCVKVNRFYEPQLIQTFCGMKIVQVCCGERHSLVLTEEGVVYGWGDNTYGQTGVGQEGEQVITSPKQWPINSKVTKIHCSRYQSFAITECGRVYFCGRNSCLYSFEPFSIRRIDEIDEPIFNEIYSLNLFDYVENVESVITSNTNTYFLTKNGNFNFCGKYLYGIQLFGEDPEHSCTIVPNKITNLHEISGGFSSRDISHIPYAIIFKEDTIYELHFEENYTNAKKCIQSYKTREEYFVKKHQITYKTIHIIHNDGNPRKLLCTFFNSSKVPRYLRYENKLEKFAISEKIPYDLKQIIKYFHIFNYCGDENILFVTLNDQTIYAKKCIREIREKRKKIWWKSANNT